MKARLARILAILSISAAAMVSGKAIAQDCYGRPFARPLRDLAPPIEQREILVLIDQTVAFPGEISTHVINQIAPLQRPGTRITIGSFSYYSSRTRPFVHLSFFFEPGFPQHLERRASRARLNQLSPCLLRRRLDGIRAIRAELSGRFASTRPSLGRSDIMDSLRQFAGHLRASRARSRTLVVVSDMLENSSGIRFYANGLFRLIDPAAEIERASRAGLIADLRGITVYVIGMGTPPPELGLAARPAEHMRRLEAFWAEYFARARAARVFFGKPFLLHPIR